MTTKVRRAIVERRLAHAGLILCSRNDSYAVDSQDGSTSYAAGLSLRELEAWSLGLIAGRSLSKKRRVDR